MLHIHPRGKPLTSGLDWCQACVQAGISTAQEASYIAPRRGKIKVGMTVSWTEFMGQDGAGNHIWTPMTGQVWSLAEQSFWSSTALPDWWVVTPDQKAWKVHQTLLKIESKEIADVQLVS